VTTYILRRLLMALLVLFIITIIVFFIMRLLPGDPLIIYMGQAAQQQAIDEGQIEELRRQFGLDKSLVVQYFNWIGGVVKGDFGESINYHEKVSRLLAERLPVTIYIGAISLVFGSIIGISIGLWAGIRRAKWPDRIITPLTYIGISIPIFWLGILMIYLFALKLHWLPTSGWTSPFDDFVLSTRKIVMPVICMSLFSIAANARQMRSSVLETIGQDYIRTAWAKGLSERIIIFRHAMKNSLIPVITLVGLQVPILVGGTVIIEQIFSLPGMGRLLINAIAQRDYPIVSGMLVVVAVAMVLINLLVDLAYAFLDPRIRYK